MAIAFEMIKPGMTLYDRRRQPMGNTSLRSWVEWTVKVVSVDAVGRTAMASWNDNRPTAYPEWELTRLHDWSMRDPGVELTIGMAGSVTKIRRVRKSARKKG